MPVESPADLAGFFNTNEFGAVATITINGGDPFDVAGIFDEPAVLRGTAQDNQYKSHMEISGNRPMFRAPTAALASVKAARAAVSIVDGYGVAHGTFGVHEAKRDGLGSTFLILTKA